MANCKICGEPHKACGGPSAVAPVDLRIAENKGAEVAGNRRYNVQGVGRRGAVPTVMLLSDEDAKARGLTEKDLFVAEKPKAAPKTETPKAPAKTPAKRAPRATKGRAPAKNKQVAPAANKQAATEDEADKNARESRAQGAADAAK